MTITLGPSNQSQTPEPPQAPDQEPSKWEARRAKMKAFAAAALGMTKRGAALAGKGARHGLNAIPHVGNSISNLAHHGLLPVAAGAVTTLLTLKDLPRGPAGLIAGIVVFGASAFVAKGIQNFFPEPLPATLARDPGHSPEEARQTELARQAFKNQMRRRPRIKQAVISLGLVAGGLLLTPWAIHKGFEYGLYEPNSPGVALAQADAKLIGGTVEFLPGQKPDGLGATVPGAVVYNPVNSTDKAKVYSDSEMTKRASNAVEAHKTYCAAYVSGDILQLKTPDHKTLYVANNINWTSSTDTKTCEGPLHEKPKAPVKAGPGSASDWWAKHHRKMAYNR